MEERDGHHNLTQPTTKFILLIRNLSKLYKSRLVYNLSSLNNIIFEAIIAIISFSAAVVLSGGMCSHDNRPLRIGT